MLTELTYTIDEELDEIFKIELLKSAIGELDLRDQKVLLYYFGIGVRPHTEIELGNLLGLTRERIRQLRDRALTKIAESATGQKLRDYTDSNWPVAPSPLTKNAKPKKQVGWRNKPMPQAAISPPKERCKCCGLIHRL
jgi:hypothetical protein